MKKNFLFILFIFIYSNTFSQSPKIKIDGQFVDTKKYFNHLSEPSIKWERKVLSDNKMGLKGQVKSMKIYAEVYPKIHKATKSKSGFVRSNGKAFQVDIEFRFNKEGYIVERSSILKDDKRSYKYIYEYDKLGNKINAKHYRPYYELVSEKRMKYNEFNQKIEEEKFENHNLVSRFDIKYDQINRIVTSVYNDIIQNINRKSVYEFTNTNERKKLTFYDFEGNLNRYIEYTHNERELLVKKFFKDLSKNEDHTTLYKYNKAKNLTSEIQTNKEGKIIFEKHLKYDKKGKLIDNNSSGVFSMDPLINKKIKMTNEITEIIATDEHGNWTIKSISTVNGVEYIKHREIVYF